MSVNAISYFIYKITPFLPVAAAIIGLLRFRQLTPPLRYLALLACFDASMELTSLLLTRVVHLSSNLFMFPIVLTGELWLVALLYRAALQSAAFSRAMPWLVGFFAFYALLDQFISHAAIHYAPGVQVVSYLLMLGMVWLYFRKLLGDLQVERLSRESVFLFSICLAVYALGNVLIALFSNYMLQHYSRLTQILLLDVVRNLFNVELYICYIVLLWRYPRK